ncbi:MAG: hypothetical protein FDW93_06135 [Bergeyella sp.]|nr:hypothetical protein [Bergeyella sp.]
MFQRTHFGGIFTSFSSMYPVMFPSNNQINDSLTIYDTKNIQLDCLRHWFGHQRPVLLAVLYFVLQKRILSEKMDDLEYDHSAGCTFFSIFACILVVFPLL